MECEMNKFPGATKQDAEAFLKHCQWVQDCWMVHSTIFKEFKGIELCKRNGIRGNIAKELYDNWQTTIEDDGPLIVYIDTSLGRVIGAYKHISQVNIILQIAKLHDAKKKNLTIKCFKKALSYEKSGKPLGIMETLDLFYEDHIKDPRDKIVAHNDRESYVEGRTYPFPENNNINEYMGKLKELAKIISDHWECKDIAHGINVRNDAKTFVDTLKMGHKS